jgi:hypothetical protein
VPLHTVHAPRFPRLGRVAVLAVAISMTTGATADARPADVRPAPQLRTIAEPSQPTANRYFDIEANKAAGMRALSRHMRTRHSLPSPARVDAAAHAATIRAIGAALVK